MRVLTSKYGFFVTILLFWFVVENTKTDKNKCDETKMKNLQQIEENSKLSNFIYSTIKSSNYTKYLFENITRYVPSPENPAVIEKVDRSFLSVGQSFLSCGSKGLFVFEIFNDGDDKNSLLSTTLPFEFSQTSNPQQLENVLKGLTIGDTKSFLTNLDKYPANFKNYKNYKNTNQYIVSVKTINVTGGVLNKFPIYFHQKTDVKNPVPLCEQKVKVAYTIYDLLTSKTIYKASNDILYEELSKMPISYPLLALGIKNKTEVVASKLAILNSISQSSTLNEKIAPNFADFKETDQFLITAEIEEIL
jgi:hypothetical protein